MNSSSEGYRRDEGELFHPGVDLYRQGSREAASVACCLVHDRRDLLSLEPD